MCAIYSRRFKSCAGMLSAPDLSNAMQSKHLRDPFREWPALELMEVEVTDSSEVSEDGDSSKVSEDRDECTR